MHKLKDTTTKIKIIKMTQGYTLGKPNEGENPSKTLPFIQADTLPFEIGFYSTSKRRIITLCLAHLQIWLYLVENHWIRILGCFSKKLLAFTRTILNLEQKQVRPPAETGRNWKVIFSFRSRTNLWAIAWA